MPCPRYTDAFFCLLEYISESNHITTMGRNSSDEQAQQPGICGAGVCLLFVLHSPQLLRLHGMLAIWSLRPLQLNISTGCYFRRNQTYLHPPIASGDRVDLPRTRQQVYWQSLGIETLYFKQHHVAKDFELTVAGT